MLASVRILAVIGLVVLSCALLVVAVNGVYTFTRPIPLSCLQSGGSLGSHPAECQRSPGPYVGGVVLLGAAVGVLWRFLNRK
jgi:hypothetical protein